MISYEDFDLRIQPDGDGFVVSARRGSQSASEPFEIDLSLCWDLVQLEKRGSRQIREQGSALFDALIRGRIRDLYQQARGGIGSDHAKGLRIRMMIDPRHPRLRSLLGLPWEILFDRSADSGHPPALDPRRPIVRTVDSIEETVAPVGGELSKVLLASSNPRNSATLDLDGECSRIEEALDRISVRPDILRHATRSRFLESIRDGEPQIVHFMGHGTFAPSIGEGVLLLEDGQGGQDPLRASTFASFFTGKPMPRLVVLASCLSADAGADPAFGPFASIAASLVAAGLPAVIAMQTKVRDRSAIRFSTSLYRLLAKRNPVEVAVAAARNALHAENTETLDWAVPVLFIRGHTGNLAPLPSPALPDPPPREPTHQTNVNNTGPIGVQVFGNVKFHNGGGGKDR